MLGHYKILLTKKNKQFFSKVNRTECKYRSTNLKPSASRGANELDESTVFIKSATSEFNEGRGKQDCSDIFAARRCL